MTNSEMIPDKILQSMHKNVPKFEILQTHLKIDMIDLEVIFQQFYINVFNFGYLFMHLK